MKVCIIGLGWLGLPLADLLVSKGLDTYGTTRCADKASEVLSRKINASVFSLYDDLPNKLPPHFFMDAHLVLNIPPGRQGFTKAKYVSSMKALIDHAFLNGLKHLVFISTTAVFGGLKGKITNQSVRCASTQSGLAHVEIEDYLFDTYPNKTCILRPSGLVGGKRHPVLSLSNKSDIKLGKNPVNLIHRQDVIAAIIKLIDSSTADKAFNLACVDHPRRDEYYKWCAQELNIQEPDFAHDERELSLSLSKWIDAQQTFDELNIDAQFSSVYSLLNGLD